MMFLKIAVVMTLASFLLQLCPVSFEMVFEEEFSLRIGFLFFHYRVLPRPQKKKKKKEQKKKEKPARVGRFSKIKELALQKGFSGFLKLLQALSQVALQSAKKIFSHTTVRLLWLNLTVGGEDAAQTAVRYGEICGLVSSSLTALLSAVKYRERDVKVRVAPDFQNEKSSVKFRARLKIKLLFLLTAVLSALIGILRVFLQNRKESGQPDQKEKAVL